MEINELKTSIDGLEIGMYVSRLDKPWMDTPFDLEGLIIKTSKDIEILRRYTAFVYVDVDKGPSPDPKFWISVSEETLNFADAELPPIEAFKTKKNEYSNLRRAFYEIETSFSVELETATGIKNQIEKDLKKILHDLENGKNIDIELLKVGVEASVGSILRNPSAFSLLVQLEKTDEYSYSHALSTSIWCAQFGRHLGLEKNDIQELALGGMLLDVGKVKLPKELLIKKGVMSPEESLLVHQHVKFSHKILSESPTPLSHKIMNMVATHHERADGSGYPDQIENKDIPIYGRIAGIVDSYDAMTTSRPYSDRIFSPNDAINEFYQMRGSSFQEELVEQFIQTVGLYPTGSLVELNNGSVGIVTEVNELKRLHPSVMLILDKDKLPLEEFTTINLSDSNKSGLLVDKALPLGSFGIKLEELFL